MIFAVPLKLIPFIVRAFWRAVAVAAFPVVFWFHAILTHGRLIFVDPLNETHPIVLAV